MNDVLVDIRHTDRTDGACGDILGFDFSEMTSAQLETVLVEAEAGVARLRLLQTAALRTAAQRQIPTADGCKSLSEWAASRLDVSSDTAKTLSRLSKIDVVAEDGDSTDRIVATSRLATSGATESEL
ncbi:MAG: hypothetical protein GEU79_15900, partial [Acidimicrobiia bacterium]|nr:hypothetical protein [Acidimicrobiia bacterium]